MRADKVSKAMVFMIGLVGVECAEGHKVYCKSKAWYVADKEKNIIFSLWLSGFGSGAIG